MTHSSIRSGVSTTAMAQAKTAAPPPPAEQNANVLLEADEIINDDAAQTITAQGDVQVRYQGRTMRADRLVYNLQTGEIHAIGDVQIALEDGSVTYAEEIEADEAMNVGAARELRSRIGDGGTLAARAAIRSGEGESELRNVIYTSCPICSTGDRPPTWSLLPGARLVVVEDCGHLSTIEQPEAVTRALVGGRYDHAEIHLFMVNYADPSMGKLDLKTGWLGEVTLQGGAFVAEMCGISSRLQQVIGEVYTSTCRAKLGDARCGIHAASYTVSGTVTAVEAAHAFYDSSKTQSSGYFSAGLVTFTSGANAGVSMEVREFSGGRFALFLPLSNPIAIGDAYTAIAGCDKRFDTCVSRFGNAINFRGEPHVPGTDKLLETSATRTAS